MSTFTLSQLSPRLREAVKYQDLAPGQILYQQGEAADSLFFVESGRLKLVTFSEQQLINHLFVRAGESFAENSLFAETYVCTAIAVTASRIAKVPKVLFLEEMHERVDLYDAVYTQLTRHYQAIKTLLELRSIRSAQERVLHYLRLQMSPNESTVTLALPLKDVAAELGLTPEAFSRTLSQLQSDGVISRKGKRIAIA
ncbi:MAG: Crp/Fnr family transcriptional regulator [Cyanobacteria bacterium J06635_1]